MGKPIANLRTKHIQLFDKYLLMALFIFAAACTSPVSRPVAKPLQWQRPTLQVESREPGTVLLRWSSAQLSASTTPASVTYRVMQASMQTISAPAAATDPQNWHFEEVGHSVFLQFVQHKLLDGKTYAWQIVPQANGMTGSVSNLVTASVVIPGTIDTLLTEAPTGFQAGSRVTFAFRADPDMKDATFTCSLDDVPAFACTSPLSYNGLDEGSHVFRVRAWWNKVSDPTPAEATFVMDLEPDTLLLYGPVGSTPLSAVYVAVTSPAPDLSGYLCRLDNAATTFCSANSTISAATAGTHSLRIWAVDIGGLTDTTPLSVNWEKVAVSSWHAATLTTGFDHACALTEAGEAFCMGAGSFGRLGLGHNNEMASPAALTSATPWSAISAGRYHSCGIKKDNSLWCWGYNMFGQLGSGDYNNQNLPVQVSGQWRQVAAGQWHTCAVKNDNTGWCWGYNQAFRLGNGFSANSNVPSSLWNGGNIYKAMAAGGGHACAIRTDNSLACWGLNDNGQVGDNSRENRWEPVAVAGNRSYLAISTGGAHSCAIETNGDLWCWGDNIHGQLGNRSHVAALVPVRVSEPGPWQLVTTGANHSCGIKQDGSLWCWGDNSGWQLGWTDGDSTDHPQQLGQDSTWLSVSAGRFLTCGLRNNPLSGTLWCWGQASLAASPYPEYIP